MNSFAQKLTRPSLHTALTACLALYPVVSASAQQETSSTTTEPSVAELQAWHKDLKNYAPVEGGCFQTTYPRVQWEKVACGPAPIFVSARRPKGASTNGHADLSAKGDDVGNGDDYAAQTAGITDAALGFFPVVKHVTSEKGVGVPLFGGGGLLGPHEYSLQLNTDINSSATACSTFGYSSCQVWEQFLYATAYQASPAQVFIQNWVFPSAADYSSHGCPSGWYDAGGSCFTNSSATNVPSVHATHLGNLTLSGSVSNGTDTVIFTDGSQAYSVTEPDSTVSLSSWWKQSEFNVVGNAGGAQAVFNKGASISVQLVVQDGSTNAPTCLSKAGTTGESNNLNAGSCQTASGASPSISFAESD